MAIGRVVIRLDGARQNFNLRHCGQTFIDPALFDRVEVLHRPGSTLRQRRDRRRNEPAHLDEAQRLTLIHLASTDGSRSPVTADRPTGVEIDREIHQHTTTLRHEFAPPFSPR